MNNEPKRTTIFDNIPTYNNEKNSKTIANYENEAQSTPVTSELKSGQAGIFDNIPPYNNANFANNSTNPQSHLQHFQKITSRNMLNNSDIEENKTDAKLEETATNALQGEIKIPDASQDTLAASTLTNEVIEKNINSVSAESQPISNFQTDSPGIAIDDGNTNGINTGDVNSNITIETATNDTNNQQASILKADNNVDSENVQISSEINDSPKQYQDQDELKKQKVLKITILIAIIIFVFIAIIVGYSYYQSLQNQNVFKLAVNNAFNYLNSNISEYDSFDGTFTIKMNSSSTDAETEQIYSIINNIDISGTYAVDMEEKIANFSLNTNYKNDELLNITAYTESSQAYLYLDNVYDKYIITTIEDYDSYFDNNLSEYETVFSSVNAAIVNSLKDEYFTIEEETIDNTKVKKTTLTLTKEIYNAIKTDFINYLMEDEEFINALVIINEVDEDVINERLQGMLDTDDSFEETTEISIYTKSNYDFVKLSVSNESGYLTVSYEDNKYSYEMVDEITEIEGYISIITEDNTTTYELSATEDGTTINYTITNSINYNTTINKIDIANSINYDDISDEDLEEIYNNIISNDGMTSLIEDIENMYNYSYYSFESDIDSTDL